MPESIIKERDACLPPAAAQPTRMLIETAEQTRLGLGLDTATLKPTTVPRRVSVVAAFHRTAVIGGILPASPAEFVRRPYVSAESPTLG